MGRLGEGQNVKKPAEAGLSKSAQRAEVAGTRPHSPLNFVLATTPC